MAAVVISVARSFACFGRSRLERCLVRCLVFWSSVLGACNHDGTDDPADAGSGSVNEAGTAPHAAGTNHGSGGNDAAGGTNGTPTTSDFPDARIYVDAHNTVRAAVPEPADYSGSWAPVPPVTWSDEVAATAQAWAEHLRDNLDCGLMHASGTGYGENLAAGTNVDAARAVAMWASEEKNYSYSAKYAFENNTGHYTQIVWRKTTQIGCGRATCGSSAVIACRYSPPGNFIGQAPY
jgi:pathogenesis-related protein 1